MKKTIYILTALFFLSGIAASSFAQTQSEQAKTPKKAEASVDVVRGRVVSIDTTKNEIVVKESKTGAEKTISVSPKDITNLKADDKVKIKLKAGTSEAESVNKIIKKKDSECCFKRRRFFLPFQE